MSKPVLEFQIEITQMSRQDKRDDAIASSFEARPGPPNDEDDGSGIDLHVIIIIIVLCITRTHNMRIHEVRGIVAIAIGFIELRANSLRDQLKLCVQAIAFGGTTCSV